MKAEIIAVGSELLTPDRIDTNSLFITEELNKLGIEVLRKTIVGDDRELLAEAFRDALNRVPVVIASGGLGPTEDDLTRETVAELLGRRLQSNDAVVRAIEARFRSFRREMPAVNLRQAMVPEGAEVLPNPRGTAPGLWLEDKGRMVALLPGPPRELKPLFLEQVLPRLEKRSNAVRMFHRELRVTGLGESHVEERIRPLYTRHREVHTPFWQPRGRSRFTSVLGTRTPRRRIPSSTNWSAASNWRWGTASLRARRRRLRQWWRSFCWSAARPSPR